MRRFKKCCFKSKKDSGKVSKILYEWTLAGYPTIFETAQIESEIINNKGVWEIVAELYAKKLEKSRKDIEGYHFEGSEEYKSYKNFKQFEVENECI